MRATVAAGDYAIHALNGRLLAAVERKTLDNLAATVSDGTLAFQLQRLAELPLAAVIIEARYSALFKLEPVNGNWLADQLTRLQVRYPRIPIVGRSRAELTPSGRSSIAMTASHRRFTIFDPYRMTEAGVAG